MIKKSLGTDQDSTANTLQSLAVGELAESGSMGQPVVNFTLKQSLELPTEPYLVELELNFGGMEGRFEFRSSIEVHSYEEGLGIFRELSAYISNIASRVQSNGE
jgi:hypothetical protein